MPIRTRLALGAGLITIVLVGVGGLLFVRSFRSGQIDALDRGLVSQADTVRRRLHTTPGLDLGQQGPSGIVATREVVVQVLTHAGAVLDATREAGDRALISDSALGRARRGPVFTEVLLHDEQEPFRVLARPVTTDDGDKVLVVGASLEETDASVDRVQVRLLVGGTLAVVAATVGGWLLAVAALRPVERMRREAAATSALDSDRRLPVPATRDEVASLAETINALLDRLHGALEQQRAFVADAGHELRTPLAVLKAELELAQRAPRTAEELRDAIRHADVEIDRLARLADALLLLARDDADQMSGPRTQVAVGALVERSVRAFLASAADRGVHIDDQVEPDLVVTLDEDLVRRALDNLLDNAVRHAPPGSTVEVRARRNDQAVEISVRDEGPGFAEEFLPHAFERFQRADDARARGDGGAGLGLAIVAAIARAHRGSVHAANAAGGGAVVSLVLPVHM